MPSTSNTTSDVVAVLPLVANSTAATTTTANLQVQVGRYQDLVLRLRVLVRAMFDIQPSTTNVDTVADGVQKGLLEGEMMNLVLYDMGLVYAIVKGVNGVQVDMQRLGSVFTFCTRWYAQEILAALLIMSPHMDGGGDASEAMTKWWNMNKSKKATADYLHTLNTSSSSGSISTPHGGHHSDMERCYLSDADRGVCRALYMQLVGGIPSAPPNSSSSSVDEVVETSLQTTAATAALYPLLLPAQRQVAQEDVKTPAATIISDIPNPHLENPTATSYSSSQTNVHTTELGHDLFVQADKTPEGRRLVERFRSSISHSLSSLLLHRPDGVFGLIRVLLLDDRVEQSFVHEAVRILVKVVVHGVATRSEGNFKTICRQVCGVLRMQFSGTGLDAFGKSTKDVREEERRRLRLRGVGSEAVIERMLRQRDTATGTKSGGGGGANASMDALDETLGFRLHLALTALCEGLANHGHIHRGEVPPSSASPQQQPSLFLSPFERLSAINSTLLGPLFAPISLRRPANIWLLKDSCGMVTSADRVDVLKGTPIVDEVLGALNGLHALLAGSSDATFGGEGVTYNTTGNSSDARTSSSSRRFIMMVLPAVLPALVSLWSTITDMKNSHQHHTTTAASIAEGRLWGWYAIEMRLRQVWRFLVESPTSALSPQSEEISMMVISAMTTTPPGGAGGGGPRWQLLKRKDVVPVATNTPAPAQQNTQPPPVRDALVVYASDVDIANSIASSHAAGKWEVSYPSTSSRNRVGISPDAVRALLGLSGDCGCGSATLPRSNNVPFVHKLLTIALETAVAEVFELSNNKALLDNTVVATSSDNDDELDAETAPPLQALPQTTQESSKKKFLIEVMSSTNADGDNVDEPDVAPLVDTSMALTSKPSAGSQQSRVAHRVRTAVDIVTAILDVSITPGSHPTTTSDLPGSSNTTTNVLGLLAGYESPSMWTISTLIGLLKLLCHIASIIGEQLLLLPFSSHPLRLSSSISGLSCVLGGIINAVMGTMNCDGGSSCVASAIMIRHLDKASSPPSENQGEGGSASFSLLLEKVKFLMDWSDTLLSSTSNAAARCSTASSNSPHADELATKGHLGVSEAVIKDAVEKIGNFGKAVRACIETAEQRIRDNRSADINNYTQANVNAISTNAEKDMETLEAASKVVARMVRPISKIEARGTVSPLTSSPWELAVCLRECAELVEELCDAQAFRNLSTLLLQASSTTTSSHVTTTSQMVNVLQRTAFICLSHLVPPATATDIVGMAKVGPAPGTSAASPKPSSSTDLFVASSCVRILTLMLLQRLDGCGGTWLAGMIKSSMEAALWVLTTEDGQQPQRNGSVTSCGSLMGGWMVASSNTKTNPMRMAPPPAVSGSVAILVGIIPASSNNLSSSSSKRLINLVGAQIKPTPKATPSSPPLSAPHTVVMDTQQAGTLLCVLLEVLVSVCDYDSTCSTIRLLDATHSTTPFGVSLPITASSSTSDTDEVIGNRVFIQANANTSSTTGVHSSSSSLFQLLQHCVGVSARHQATASADPKLPTMTAVGDRRLLISAIYTLGSVVPLLHPRLSVPDVLDWIVSELFKGGGTHIPMMARAAAAAAVYRLAVSLVEMENAHAHITLQSAQATGKMGMASGAHIRVHGEQRPLLLPIPSSSLASLDHAQLNSAISTSRTSTSVGGGSTDVVPRGVLLILRDLQQLGTLLANYKAPAIFNTKRGGGTMSPPTQLDGGIGGRTTTTMEVDNVDDADDHHVHTIRSYGAALQTLLKP